mmetsp:Transcript_10166/g.15323  ORF Transcript_10166/g.15323 Transcript_10166/m.15323 type:complete len:198 (-) Transcript_10166:99-692(-)
MKVLLQTTAAILSSFFVSLTGAADAERGTGAGAVTCPGSPSWQHAKCSMMVSFPSHTCAQVREEITLRLTETSFIDPHNNGTYKLTSTTDDGSDGGNEVVTGERLTGDGKYTDKFVFTFTESLSSSSSGCQVTACSESQVFSILDFSTNYCNLRNLYCNGSKDGCVTQQYDFLDYEEKYVKCGQNVVEKCIVSTSNQ